MPPTDRRPKLDSFVRYFVYADYDRRYNEAYAYYKVFILNLYMNFFFMAAYYISFVWRIDLNLGFFRIRYRPDAAVDELVYGYPLHVFPFLTIVTVVYSVALFLFRTDYLSRRRIITEETPVLDSNDKLYDRRPYTFLLIYIFFLYGGYNMSTLAWYFREYELYNWFHNFRSHGKDNFIIFAIAYFIVYQAMLAQVNALVSVNLIRSVFRFCLYGSDFKKTLEENKHDDE